MKERFGFTAIAQAQPKDDSASAGTIWNAIRLVRKKVRPLVVASRELHGVVMSLEHVALALCVRFAEQITFRAVKGSTKKNVQLTSLTASCWASRIRAVDVWKTPSGGLVCRAVKRRLREDALRLIFFNCLRGILRHPVPDDDVARESREPWLGTDRLLVKTDLLPPISAEPSKPSRVYIWNSVNLARFGCALDCPGFEATVSASPGLSRDHPEQCGTRNVQSHVG